MLRELAMKTLATNSKVMRTKKILLTSIVMSIFFSLFSISSANAGSNIDADRQSRNTILCDDDSVGGDKSPQKCLPAYRYDDFRVEGKFQKIFKLELDIFGTIASGVFSAANLVWSITLVFIKAGLSIDLLSSMGPTINNGIATLYDTDLIKTIFLLGLIMVIYVNIIKPAFGIGKNKTKLGTKNFMAFAQPLFIMGIIAVIGSSSLSASNKYINLSEEDKKSYLASDSKGTIPWFVGKVSYFVGNMSSGLADTLTANETLTGVQKESGSIKENAFGDPKDLLTCDKYNKNLHAMFDKSIENSPNKNSIQTLGTLSTLWENTFYDSYAAAIFGPPADDGKNIGGRINCHYLETYNRVSPAERAQIINASGPVIVSKDSKVLQLHEKEEDSLRAWMAFALCKNTGGSFQYNTLFFNDPKFLANDKCTKAFNIKFDNDGLSTNQFDIDAQPVYKDQEAANSFISNLKDDGPTKIILAFIALLVSLVFLWTFGWLSIGLIFVNITSVIVLTISPIILAASLFVTGERRSKVFSLFKLLGTAIVTKFLFTLLIVLLLKISTIGSNMVQFLPLGNGLISSIVIGFMPLVALIVMRKILNAFSLGDILKAGGALALALNTQNQALSMVDKSKSGLADKLKSAGSKIPMKNSIDQRLGKFDRIGPQAAAKKALSKKYRDNAKKVVADEKKEIRDKREKKREARDPENSYTDKFMENMNSMGVSLDSVGDKAREVGDSVKKSGAAVLGGGILLGTGGAAIAAGAIAGGSAYNRLKNKKNKSDKDTSSFNPEGLEIKKQELGNNTKIAANTRENNRNRNKKKQNLNNSSLENYDAEVCNSALLEYNKKAYGDEFEGFANRGQLKATAENYASVNGYEDSEILMSNATGLIIPNPTANRENLSNDQLKHWVYYLDKNTIERKTGESDSDLANRLFSVAHQRGLISSEGEAFNPIEHFDIDINSTQMLDFVKSVSDINDKAFKISSKNSSLEKQITDGVLKAFKDNGFPGYGASLGTIKIGYDLLESEIKSTSKEASLIFSTKVADIANISGEIKKIQFRLENEEMSNEIRETLRKEILSQSDRLVSEAKVQRNELFREITDNIAKQIGTDAGYAALSAADIKEQIVKRINEIEPMFDQIENSIYNEINTGNSTLIDDLTNIHKELKKRNAELISQISTASKDIAKDISLNFEKAGDLTNFSNLHDLISEYGSSRFPTEGRK